MQGFHSFFKAAQWAREEEKRKEERKKENEKIYLKKRKKNVWPGTSEPHRGVAIAQWLELRIRDPKISGWSPGKSGGRFFLFSRVNLLRWLLLRYPFHPRVTAVVHQKKWIKKKKHNKKQQLPVTFGQTCRWLITAKHACTLRMWLCMKWRDIVHGCVVYTERAEMAAV